MNWWTTIRTRIERWDRCSRHSGGARAPSWNRDRCGVAQGEPRSGMLTGQGRRQPLPPALPQICDLGGWWQLALGAADEGDGGRVDVEEAALGEAEGEIDVVERAPEPVRGEPAERLEAPTRHHHAV